MKNIKFPVKLVFRISTLSNDYRVLDADGRVIAYVRQKMFKFKEDIQIFTDTDKSKLLYTIKADKWIDWSAAYAFKRADGSELGKIARKGWRSLWKAEYDLIDQFEAPQYKVKENNGWVKVFDSLLGEIPILGMLTGYLFNPSYNVLNNDNQPIVTIKKDPSFFGRKFTIEKRTDLDEDDQERIILGLMMMILLERRRG